MVNIIIIIVYWYINVIISTLYTFVVMGTVNNIFQHSKIQIDGINVRC